MTTRITPTLISISRAVICLLFASAAPPTVAGAADLLQQYPTALTAGDPSWQNARPWQFTAADVFQVSQFHFEVGQKLRVETGPADVGIGHCIDGAVWAVLIPRQSGELWQSITNRPEAVSHVWLRFHPAEIANLLPPSTVLGAGETNRLGEMRAIAVAKMPSSWQVGGKAMIPEPRNLTLDVDTKGGVRRFFSVDKEKQTADYWPVFEDQAVRLAPPIDRAAAEASFDQIWETFDRKYAMFVLRPEVDWRSLRDQYRSLAVASHSTYDFAGICAELLKPLRDLHVWITVAGTDVPVYDRPRFANANPRAGETVIGNLHRQARVAWAVTTNHVGYLEISGWDDPKISRLVGEALEKMRATRGLVLDVRLNGGGDELLAGTVAGRFLANEFVYAYSQYRNGPHHTNLTEKIPRRTAPSGPWRYDRPVLLLIGQKCMSSTESFAAMMTGAANVTTMGDRTCGSSGAPETMDLPIGMTVSVPRWIDYLPDGTPLDERGLAPQIPFVAAPGAFEDGRDDLLAAALAKLSAMPLPDTEIAGPVFDPVTAALPDHSRDIREEALDSSRPRVVWVTPTNGASGIETTTELHVRFDQPMDPLSVRLNWDSGGFVDCEFPRYDPGTFEFTFPVRLVPGLAQQIVVNEPRWAGAGIQEERRQHPRDGFQSTGHQLAGLFAWRFTTATNRAPQPGSPPARVTVVSPAAGSRVPFRLFLEIQFDQPMKPPPEAFPSLVPAAGSPEPRMISRIDYDPIAHKFRIPLLLPPGEKLTFTLTGFQSAAGIAAEPVRLQYLTSLDEWSKEDRAALKAAANDPSLSSLLKSMQRQRKRLHSLSERVQNLTLREKDGRLVEIQSQVAVFKWQKPNRYYGDVTGLMLSCSDFRIGSDGRQWWWLDRSARRTNFVLCSTKELSTPDISVCDPFGLAGKRAAAAAAEGALHYEGSASLGPAGSLRVEGWTIEKIPGSAPFGSFVQWWIDAKTFLPIENAQFSHGFVSRMRFFYDAVNEPLSEAEFAAPRVEDVLPTRPKPLDADQTGRVVIIHDGADGRMRLRWGTRGPGGISGSGLN